MQAFAKLPQTAVVWANGGTHVPFWQQPPAHVIGPHAAAVHMPPFGNGLHAAPTGHGEHWAPPLPHRPGLCDGDG